MITPFRLLVAADGSPCADDRIEDLQNVGIPAQARVPVVSAAERWLPPPSVYELAPTPGVPRGKNQAARIFARHPEWTVEYEGHTGSPARGSGQRATEFSAQFVAAGSQGHNAIERVLNGGTSQKVANGASCPVRVSRGKRGAGYLRLLLAYDARPGSGKAASVVASRHWPQGTECRLPSHHGRVEAPFSPAVEMLFEAGLDVYTSLQDANAKHRIVDEAIRLDAHGIFAGCNGHSLVDRLPLGTVSNVLISRAPCAVEVVR